MMFFILILGLIVGSFLCLVIDRLPLGRSIVIGRSQCDTCDLELESIDLIPVLSYLIFKARCRRCKSHLSLRYPMIEILTALSFIAAYSVFGWYYETLVACILASILIVIAIIDIDTFIIYDRFHFMILILGFALLIMDPTSFKDRILAMFIVSVPYLILAVITQGIGGGDVKLIAAAGLLLGTANTILAFLISTILGGFYALYLVVRKQAKAKQAIPFGPFLCIGIYTAFLYGSNLVHYYFSLFL